MSRRNRQRARTDALNDPQTAAAADDMVSEGGPAPIQTPEQAAEAEAAYQAWLREQTEQSADAQVSIGATVTDEGILVQFLIPTSFVGVALSDQE